MNNNRGWRSGGLIRRVYKYDDKHRDRLGDCEWLPKDGDLCVCVGHSGDCFSDYVAMRKLPDGRFEMVGAFGAYNFAEPGGVLPVREYHLLQAGEPINYPFIIVKLPYMKELVESVPKESKVGYIIVNRDGNYWKQDGSRPGYWLLQMHWDKTDATRYTLKEAEAKAEELSVDHRGLRILALIYLRKGGRKCYR